MNVTHGKRIKEWNIKNITWVDSMNKNPETLETRIKFHFNYYLEYKRI